MRNTPYPRYTIGNKSHKVFDLATSRGIIQGIKGISDPVEIRASDLEKFDFTPFGEHRVFDHGLKIEVVSFGGHHARGGFVSKLETQLITLEAGSKVTGPAVWRVIDNEHHALAPENAKDGPSNRESVIMALTLLSVIGFIAYLSPLAALGVVGLLVILSALVFLDSWFERGKNRRIAKMGSIYVFAPSRRTWNGGPVREI